MMISPAACRLLAMVRRVAFKTSTGETGCSTEGNRARRDARWMATGTSINLTPPPARRRDDTRLHCIREVGAARHHYRFGYSFRGMTGYDSIYSPSQCALLTPKHHHNNDWANGHLFTGERNAMACRFIRRADIPANSAAAIKGRRNIVRRRGITTGCLISPAITTSARQTIKD